MTKINTNVASLRGLRSLNKSNELLGTTLTRLSTGLQINSGKDSPAGLIAGETLRAQITTIEQSIKNSNRANNVLSTADSAMGEVSGLLNQIRGLVQEGLNDGALSDAEISANQLQIDAALSAINRISANTTFAGDKLIDGSKGFTTQQTTADAAELSDFQINEAVFGSNSTIEVVANVDTAAEKADLQFSGAGLSSETTLEVSGSRGSQVLFFGAASTTTNVMDAINAATGVTGVSASKTDAVAGSLAIDATNALADVTFTDARADADQGEFTPTIDVEYVKAGNSTALSVAVATDGNGDHTITVNLATDGNGDVTSTAAQIAAAVNGDANANALVSAAEEGVGSGIVDNASVVAAELTGGTDAVLTMSSSNYGSDEFVDINVLSGAFATTLNDGLTAASRDTGVDIGVTINGQTAQGNGLQASVKTANLDASMSFASASNTIGTSSTITITGGGSLFQIGQEVSSQGQIGIGIEAVNTARLGGISGKLYELGSGAGKSLLDVGPSTPGSTLVDIVDEAISKVNTLRGRIGAIQKNVIETNISTLSVALENISEARSSIMDADFAIETANMTRAQILSQAGTSVLSIANQTPSQVLSLLG